MLGNLYNRFAMAAISAVALVGVIAAPALAWGERIEGRPASFEAGSTDGYYLWHDDAGLHLRTTDSSGSFTYSGTLTTKSTFTDVQLVLAEKDDSVQILNGGKEIQFQFKTFQGIDGFDFRVVDGSPVELSLMQNGTLIDPSNIFLGQFSVHPDHNPMRIGETDNGSAAQPAAVPISHQQAARPTAA
ncbi:MAG TPA: hypothetical protein VKT80_09255 [Chloroflexota bacterium]|nr:hypothetical protein [Chloroflexota bacterium]